MKGKKSKKRKGRGRGKSGGGPGFVIVIIGVIALAALTKTWAWLMLLVPVVIIGIIGFVMYSVFSGQPATSVTRYDVSIPRNEAKEVALEIGLPPGKHDVRGLADPDTLLDTRISHLGEVFFNDEGEQSRHITLKPDTERGGGWTAWLNPANWSQMDENDFSWEIRLNSEIKTRLKLNTSMGDTDLDLRDLNLDILDVTCGAGDVDVILPGVPQGYHAAIRMNMGELDVRIHEPGPLNLTIQGSAGECRVQVPREAEVRLKAIMGMGSLNVSDRLHQIAGSGSNSGMKSTGMWQTPGFEDSDQQIVINFEGKMGDFKLV